MAGSCSSSSSKDNGENNDGAPGRVRIMQSKGMASSFSQASSGKDFSNKFLPLVVGVGGFDAGNGMRLRSGRQLIAPFPTGIHPGKHHRSFGELRIKYCTTVTALISMNSIHIVSDGRVTRPHFEAEDTSELCLVQGNFRKIRLVKDGLAVLLTGDKIVCEKVLKHVSSFLEFSLEKTVELCIKFMKDMVERKESVNYRNTKQKIDVSDVSSILILCGFQDGIAMLYKIGIDDGKLIKPIRYKEAEFASAGSGSGYATNYLKRLKKTLINANESYIKSIMLNAIVIAALQDAATGGQVRYLCLKDGGEHAIEHMGHVVALLRNHAAGVEKVTKKGVYLLSENVDYGGPYEIQIRKTISSLLEAFNLPVFINSVVTLGVSVGLKKKQQKRRTKKCRVLHFIGLKAERKSSTKPIERDKRNKSGAKLIVEAKDLLSSAQDSNRKFLLDIPDIEFSETDY